MADYIKPVIFRLGNQQFGVDINLVQSIEREINIVRVPNAMKYISGIVNQRGGYSCIQFKKKVWHR